MKLSKDKREKISEQILALLFQSFPKQLFTSDISKEIARDEEFVKKIMAELAEKNLVVCIKKNEKGVLFIRRQRWQLTAQAYQAYSSKVVPASSQVQQF